MEIPRKEHAQTNLFDYVIEVRLPRLMTKGEIEQVSSDRLGCAVQVVKLYEGKDSDIGFNMAMLRIPVGVKPWELEKTTVKPEGYGSDGG